jgi:hypothetical protein
MFGVAALMIVLPVLALASLATRARRFERGTRLG